MSHKWHQVFTTVAVSAAVSGSMTILAQQNLQAMMTLPMPPMQGGGMVTPMPIQGGMMMPTMTAVPINSSSTVNSGMQNPGMMQVQRGTMAVPMQMGGMMAAPQMMQQRTMSDAQIKRTITMLGKQIARTETLQRITQTRCTTALAKLDSRIASQTDATKKSAIQDTRDNLDDQCTQAQDALTDRITMLQEQQEDLQSELEATAIEAQ